MSYEKQIKVRRNRIDAVDRCAVYYFGALVTDMASYRGANSRPLGLNFLTALSLRFYETDAVGELKEKHGVESVIQEDRRQEVFERVAATNEAYGSPVSREAVLSQWQLIHDSSVQRQELQRIEFVNNKYRQAS